MISKQWLVHDPAPASLLKRYTGMSEILAQLLYNRGLQSPEDAAHFLSDREIAALAGDPRDMKDMRKAVDRIRQAIKRDEPIIVYGDFDADGVTATALMMQILTRLKANVRHYIPHRVDEGYGLNSEALVNLANDGAKLIITVDCGIRAVQEVADGKDAGLDIIITDHHGIGPELPAADAVVNPQQEDCPGSTALAGVGVAYMTARALLLDALERNGKHKQHIEIYKTLLDDVLDLVAIGTVADIMKLNDPLNRALVIQGLHVINSGRRPGIRALATVAGREIGKLTAMDIGFALGPRINAAGRLDSASEAYYLLSAQDDETARRYAERLQELNRERQDLTRSAQERIRSQIADTDDLALIFATDRDVVPGIVGLVAGRLTEEFFRPAVVVEVGEEECHASCRSIPQFHITKALDECADLLVRHGGHAMAAGLTVLPENLPVLQERLLQKARATLDGQILRPTLYIDMELPIRALNMNLAEQLELLEPTGHENPPATFVTYNMHVVDCKTVGKERSHLKLTLTAGGEPSIDAIGFGLGDRAQDMPERIDVVYHLEINEWAGRRNLQLNLQDLRPAGGA